MSDISTHGTLATSLEGYWLFDEVSGTRYDAHSSGRNLTDNNTVTQAATGVIDQGATFTSANSEYLTSGSNWTHYAAAAISFNVWVKTSTDNGTSMVMNINDGGYSTAQIIKIGGSNHYRFDIDTTTSASSPTIAEASIENGSWHMLTGTYNGSTVEFYLDAVRQGSGTARTGNLRTGGPAKLAFGARSTGADLFWNGSMDLAGAWSKALSQSEITDLYNGGAGLPYSTATSANTGFLMFF